MHADARNLIDRLGLEPHPEGGWFREVYRSHLTLPADALPGGYADARPAATSILYLLADGAVSQLHRLRGDELWLHQAGHGLQLQVLHAGGRHEQIALGAGPDQVFQVAVPAGSWVGAELPEGEGWALVACVMAPGFAEEDWELASRQDLLAAFPTYAELITRLAPASGPDA